MEQNPGGSWSESRDFLQRQLRDDVSIGERDHRFPQRDFHPLISITTRRWILMIDSNGFDWPSRGSFEAREKLEDRFGEMAG